MKPQTSASSLNFPCFELSVSNVKDLAYEITSQKLKYFALFFECFRCVPLCSVSVHSFIQECLVDALFLFLFCKLLCIAYCSYLYLITDIINKTALAWFYSCVAGKYHHAITFLLQLPVLSISPITYKSHQLSQHLIPDLAHSGDRTIVILPSIYLVYVHPWNLACSLVLSLFSSWWSVYCCSISNRQEMETT